ncbi:MAG: DNA translocase FtsK [Oscillospiraceae bacterium]|nr:DNA translocase FtsK [Oscillospiraceae bacterium]
MAQTKKPTQKPKTTAKKNAAPTRAPRRREIAAVVAFILAIFSFIGYFNTDGAFIGFFRGLVTGLVGPGFFAFPPALLLCAVILIFHRGRPVRFRVTCTLLMTVVVGALWHVFVSRADYSISFRMIADLWRDGRLGLSGGIISGTLAEIFTVLFSTAGAVVVFICFGVFLSLAALNKTIADLVEAYKNRERRDYVPEPIPEREPMRRSAPRPPAAMSRQKRRRAIDIPLDTEESPTVPDHFQPSAEPLYKPDANVKTPDEHVAETLPEPEAVEPEDVHLEIPFMESKRVSSSPFPPPPVDVSPVVTEPPAPKAKEAPEPEPVFEPIPAEGEYVFPPIDLLTAGSKGAKPDGTEEVRMNSERLEAAFHSFGVKVKIQNAVRGPSVTRYEAELEAGIKLNKLTSLSDDIALSLGASGVRIAAMPNKISTVGIEVPNKLISKVYLRDIIESPEFKNAKSKLTFAIGMDITGEAVVGNIAKLPHMLVAGTTGSGKSVCLNSLILSILYKATPDDVRLIMIDPKMVEFKVYNSIPHLLVPVVTDIKKASGALQWAVVEMMKRYNMFSETNARDLEGYNEAVKRMEDREPLPQIVVVIDELADLMMTAAKEVEESICRVAQMGRAAGIHLVIATQSPRADVITGLMKANIPSRIALKVASALESRIILDSGGNAEKLVGNGDMLYAPIGTTKPQRLQGTWVSDAERENVVEFIKRSGESRYSEEVIIEIEKAAEDKGKDATVQEDSGDTDELLPQAVDVIFDTGQASVSMLQRRLKLGYSRAARIVDQMERMGIVGPFEGSKPRALLITRDQWREMQYVSGNAPVDNVQQTLDDYDTDI